MCMSVTQFVTSPPGKGESAGTVNRQRNIRAKHNSSDHKKKNLSPRNDHDSSDHKK